MNDFKTDGWKNWNKKLKANELAEYVSFQKGENRITVFENADELVRHFNANIKAFGGNGTWDTNTLQDDANEEDTWRFGYDFPTHNKTSDALETGKTAAQYLSQVEKTKEELYERFPKLYELEQIAVTKRKRRRFSEDGNELDIDRYMCSDPCTWVSMPRQDVKNRTATFYIELAIASGTDAMNVTKGVISALALIDIVEKAGISTEIIVGATTRNGIRDVRFANISVIAKRADEPLDISRLLSFCLTGMYRQYIFGAWQNINDNGYIDGLGDGGWNFENRKEMFDFFNALVLFRVSDKYWTGSQMQIMINKVFEFFNVNNEVAS
jgi:hypothetical protein